MPTKAGGETATENIAPQPFDAKIMFNRERAPPERSWRDHVVNYLRVAASVEHALMVQYLMRDRSARRLLGDVHRLRAMAVAAFQRVVRLEASPFVQRQLESVVDELLADVDGAEQMSPDFLRRLHLARDLVGPVVRNVAIRAACADAGAVA